MASNLTTNRPGNFKDITGQKFNRLTAIEYVGKFKWLCVCDCGNRHVCYGGDLRQGKVKSCGCLRNERVKEAVGTHHSSKEKLWHVWNDMRYRCEKPYNHAYKHYGKRGISVCKEWHDYAKFKNWAISNGYAVGLTIDRIDVNGNYEPNNCRWIPQKEQAKNTRRNLDIDLTQLSTETGIIYGTLLYRYHHNLDLITGGKSNV